MLWMYWRIGKGNKSPIHDSHLDLSASIRIEPVSCNQKDQAQGLMVSVVKLWRTDFSFGNAAIAKP